MRLMRIGILGLILSIAGMSWAATNNSGNPPTFLWLDICTNGIGDQQGAIQFTRMEPGVFDIGVDLDADGTVDRWLSQEKSEFLGRDNADEITPLAWRRFYFRLDADAGKTAKIRIVDKSDEYYMAVNAIRLNYADGVVVKNEVPNGWFEEEPALTGWTILEGSITDPAQLIIDNSVGAYNYNSPKFFSTMDPSTGGFEDTVVIESDVFTLTPPTSFVYGMVSGGGSEFWNIPDNVGGSDNACGVYLDIGTEAEDPNGQYDEGVDIPLSGFVGGDANNVRNQMHPVFLNTSGQEGKRCQVVAFDNSDVFHIGMDSWRMNWDIDNIIKNGGFDEGIPTPEEDPAATDWFAEEIHWWDEHPSGKIPGWSVIETDPSLGGAIIFFDDAVHGNMFSGRTYVGTAGSEAERILGGIEIRSDVFEITPIPDPAENVFVQFNSAQGAGRHRYTSDGLSREWGAVQLQVDVNGDGVFDGEGDYIYNLTHIGMGHNLNTSNMDLWTYPEFRFYILPEHQGKQARIWCQDTLGPQRGSYGWMCVDDFFMWDGTKAMPCFPNSDFEMGSLENWTEEVGINGGDLRSWLSASQECYQFNPDCAAEHLSMNDRHSSVDGDYSADTAANEYTNGDAGTGTLFSIGFELPTLAASHVTDWSIFH